MIRRLTAAGFTVEKMNHGNVENFWATRGTTAPVLCFAGHTDVVPTGPLEEWRTDPFKPVVIDGILYGRGAADMKSGLAAMVTACEQFVHEQPDHLGSIAFLITSDEEGPSVDGTKRVVETLRQRGQRLAARRGLARRLRLGLGRGRRVLHYLQNRVVEAQVGDGCDDVVREDRGLLGGVGGLEGCFGGGGCVFFERESKER